jgi:serine protease Do
VWPLPDAGASPGALVFSLEGAFVGGVMAARTGPALVPAETLLASAMRVEHDRTPWSMGVRLQPLDAGLRAALGVSQGVVVAVVDPAGAAAGTLVTGDVITAIDGTKVDDPWDVLQRVATVDAKTGVDVEIVRDGKPASAHVAGTDHGPAAASTGPTVSASVRTPAASIGARLVPSSHGSRVQRVDRDGPAARAGLSPGDEIWWVQGTAAASPAAIARRWRAVTPGGRLAVGVDPAAPRLLAIERP